MKRVQSVLAGISACVIAVSASVLTVWADEIPIRNATESDGRYVYNVLDNLPAGASLTDVYGAEVRISGVNTERGAGGGIIFQSASVGWDQKDWGNEGSGKPVVYNYSDFTFRRLETASPFSASDSWASVVICQWDQWGDAVTVESVRLLGRDGKALDGASGSGQNGTESGASESAETQTDSRREETEPAKIAADHRQYETKSAETKTTAEQTAGTEAESGTKEEPSSGAGDAGVGYAAAGLAAACAAALLSRKKH